MNELWSEIARAIGLVLVIEGMLPFLSPNRWRKLLENMATIDERMLRIVGLITMLLGVAVLYIS